MPLSEAISDVTVPIGKRLTIRSETALQIAIPDGEIGTVVDSIPGCLWVRFSSKCVRLAPEDVALVMHDD